MFFRDPILCLLDIHYPGPVYPREPIGMMGRVGLQECRCCDKVRLCIPFGPASRWVDRAERLLDGLTVADYLHSGASLEGLLITDGKDEVIVWSVDLDRREIWTRLHNFRSLASVHHWSVIEGGWHSRSTDPPPPPLKRYTSCRRPGCCAVAL